VQNIFTGTYSCGLNGTLDDTLGKTARFDCSVEFAKCNDLKLTLINTAGKTK
jgi:hypothetical protein